MKFETQLRVWISVFWTVSLLTYLRWWEVTIRVPAIMVWTLAYTSLYVTTGFALFRRAVSTAAVPLALSSAPGAPSTES